MAVLVSSANQAIIQMTVCLEYVPWEGCNWQQRDQGPLRSCPEFSSTKSLILYQFCGGCLASSPFISPSKATAGGSLVSPEGGVSEPRNLEMQVKVTTPSYIWTALGKQFNLSELPFPLL